MDLPAGLHWMTRRADTADWLRALPARYQQIAREWDLSPTGPAYGNAQVSYVVPVNSAFGPAVLKLQWPHPECFYEAHALSVWDGDGAARLYAHDPARHALLIEKCTPGTQLGDSPEIDALSVYEDLLPALSVPAAAPFRALADEAAQWHAEMVTLWESAGRPCPVALVDAALGFIEDLAATQGPPVLLHQDLHAGNVLAAERHRFLAIDPKPLVGEREFALSPVINSFELGHSPERVAVRLDRLSASLGLDRERARGWAVAQAIAWSFDSHFARYRFDTASWLLDAA